MNFIKTYRIFEGILWVTDNDYKELAQILQSEVLDKYDIYYQEDSDEDYLDEDEKLYNWDFGYDINGNIRQINIFAEGDYSIKTILDDILSVRKRVEDILYIDYTARVTDIGSYYIIVKILKKK